MDDQGGEVAEVEEAVQLHRPVYLGAEDHNLLGKTGSPKGTKYGVTASRIEAGETMSGFKEEKSDLRTSDVVIQNCSELKLLQKKQRLK